MTSDDRGGPAPIEDQLQAWATDAGDRIPAYDATFGSTARPATGRTASWYRRMALGGAAAAAVVAIVAVGLVVLGPDDRGAVVAAGRQGGAAGITVEYERSEYVQTGDPACPPPEATDPTSFDTAVFESWGDRTGKRWRLRVTYPDGATRDVIALGSPYYPTELFTRGDPRGAALGCGSAILLSEPGQGDFFALDPMDELPGDGTRTSVRRYDDVGQRVDGTHADSRGRPADLWRQVIDGFDGAHRGLHQVEEWFVDAGSGDVLEEGRRTTVEGAGTVSSRMTRLESGTRTVPADHFDTDGFVSVGGRPMPSGRQPTIGKPLVGGLGFGPDQWRVQAYQQPGELCLEVTIEPSSATSCGDELQPAVVKLAVLGDVRVLYGMVSPDVATVRVTNASGAPATVRVSNLVVDPFGGVRFFAVRLDPGSKPVAIAGFASDGTERFTIGHLSDCVPAAGIVACRIDD
jgi:hypothetical protein